MNNYGDLHDRTGRQLTPAEIDFASRRRPASAPDPIPDIPLERYDGCACGRPRFVHTAQQPLPADEFGKACPTGFTLTESATLPL